MQLQDSLLEQYKINISNLDKGSHKIKCPNCQPPHNSKDRPLSIDVSYEKIVFFCHHCQFKGSVMSNSTRKIIPIRSAERSKSKSSALEKFFKDRGIDSETCDHFNVYEENGWVCYPYNAANGSADNIKYRKLESKDFKQVKDPRKSLYNYDHVKNANIVIFVEGENDCLAVHQCGFPNVTTLPDGAPANATYKENDKRFSCLQTHPLKAKKIILFLDNDGAGENLKKELLHRYGKAKCWVVKAPTDCKDANDVLVKHGKETLKALIDNARPVPVDGIYTVGQHYNEVIDLYDGNYAKPVTIGYPNFDQIYKVMKGTFHVWTGIPNHGKSTFLDQCLLKLASKEDWKFIMFSPEHSIKMHIRRLLQLYVGKPFDQGFNGRMSKQEATEGMRFINEHFFFLETREHVPSADKILELAELSVAKYGCNGFVIDPYNEVDGSRRGSFREDEHIKNFISKCKRFCKMHEITTWVVAHPTKLQKEANGYNPPSAYDISGAAHWHNQSDAVVVVHRDFENDTIDVITRKIREQGLYGEIGSVKFRYDYSTRNFYEV